MDINLIHLDNVRNHVHLNVFHVLKIDIQNTFVISVLQINIINQSEINIKENAQNVLNYVNYVKYDQKQIYIIYNPLLLLKMIIYLILLNVQNLLMIRMFIQIHKIQLLRIVQIILIVIQHCYKSIILKIVKFSMTNGNLILTLIIVTKWELIKLILDSIFLLVIFQAVFQKVFLLIIHQNHKYFPQEKLSFKFSSDIVMNLMTNSHFKIYNFDVLEIYNVTFLRGRNQNFIIKNNNQPVDVNLFNFSIANSNIQNTLSIFQTDIFGNIQLKQVVIVNSTFYNSSFLNFEKFPISGNIQIDNLIIQNCTINQSQLLIFKSTKGTISIINFIFEESQIYNSTIFIFNTNIQIQIPVSFTNFNIKNNTFYNSEFQNSNSSLYQSLINIKLQENTFQYSNIFDFYHNISMSNIMILDNYFQYSILFFTLETQFEFKFSNSLNFFWAKNNRLTSSNIWRIQSSLETSNLILNLFIEDVNSDDLIDYLLKFKCFQLSLNTIQIKNLTNIFIFYIYQSNYINIQNVLLEGIQNQYKVPLSYKCKSIPQLQIKLFKIMGFHSIKIIMIRIQDIFNIDESIIDINSNNQEYNTELNFLQMNDMQFLRNLMILQNQIEFTSLLKINSEKQLNKIYFTRQQIIHLKIMQACYLLIVKLALQKLQIIFLNLIYFLIHPAHLFKLFLKLQISTIIMLRIIIYQT
ncbi:unnamed protein product [Paramecium sonneborni]|uniref:Transmembrane protein n=1 Tax=Paramecium sonneborni TaxID=65129 RepID=A0A8S1RDP6_9CILI|nr:unnamed protein product [Paramecium sonneborni]